MTDTETHTQTDTQTDVPNAIFSLDDSLETLWVKSYQGEVLGEVLFGGIADQLADPDRAHKMRVLATLERKTKEAAAPALKRAGISTDPDPEMVTLAEALVEGTAQMPWDEIMGSFGTITAQYSAMYVRIGVLDPAELETSDLLVAHEAALAAFGRKELAGDLEHSLDEIEALPHLQ
jgi:hypothetical protein